MKVFTVVGNRPQFIKAAPLSLHRRREPPAVHQGGTAVRRAPRSRRRRGRPPHGAALVPRRCPRSSSTSSASPSRATGSISTPPTRTRCSRRSRRGSLPSRPTSSSSTATRTRRSPARAPPRTRRFRSRTSRPGCAAATSSMPEEHNRIETDRLAWLLFCPDDRSRRTLEGEGVLGRIYVVGDVMADASRALRPARASGVPGAARARARTSSRRSTARRTSSSRVSGESSRG